MAHNTTGDTCDVVYHFGFDDRNRATTVKVSNKLLPGENDTVLNLSTNVYNNEYNNDNTLKETTFGNGGKVKNTYDEFKRLKGVRYDSDTEDRYVYDYAANGQIAKATSWLCLTTPAQRWYPKATTLGVNSSILPAPCPPPWAFSTPSAIGVTSTMKKRASTTSEAGIIIPIGVGLLMRIVLL